MDLSLFLKQTAEDPFAEAPNRRKRIERAELAARLKYYEKNTPGFEGTEEHLDALVSIFTEHRHVLITGGAGVGKTTFVKAVVMPELDYRNMHWSVTATTGIAGSHLDGKTMHSFFGIGLGPDWPPCYPKKMCEFLADVRPGADVPRAADMSKEELDAWYEMFYERWMTDPKIKPFMRHGVLARLRAHEVLLLDEVSMLSGAAMLGYLDFMLKRIRGNEQPFGGLQMVFIGDFAQLPPVEEGMNDERPDWAFLARAWDDARVKPIALTKVFRQGDHRFVEFLNNIRVGITTQDDRAYARRFVRKDMTLEETRFYTFLVPTNKQAKAINAQALEHYPAPTQPLDAEFCIVPGVQQMKDWETKNVEGVKDELTKALQRRLLDKRTFVRIGYPVMFTVNDPDESYDEDNIVIGVPGRKPEDEERLVALYRHNYTRTREQDPRELIVVPPSWRMNIDNPKLPPEISLYPTVRQFPLIPATSITIHKSQGLSMDSAILALSRAFASGHVYVGLSRLRSPEGLILAEDDFVAKVDPHVMRYYRSIREGNADAEPPNIVP
jgi:hypothetical protein